MLVERFHGGWLNVKMPMERYHGGTLEWQWDIVVGTAAVKPYRGGWWCNVILLLIKVCVPAHVFQPNTWHRQHKRAHSPGHKLHIVA